MIIYILDRLQFFFLVYVYFCLSSYGGIYAIFGLYLILMKQFSDCFNPNHKYMGENHKLILTMFFLCVYARDRQQRRVEERFYKIQCVNRWCAKHKSSVESEKIYALLNDNYVD